MTRINDEAVLFRIEVALTKVFDGLRDLNDAISRASGLGPVAWTPAPYVVGRACRDVGPAGMYPVIVGRACWAADSRLGSVEVRADQAFEAIAQMGTAMNRFCGSFSEA